MDNIRAQFYFFIGNFVEFSYKEIKPSAAGVESCKAEFFLNSFHFITMRNFELLCDNNK